VLAMPGAERLDGFVLPKITRHNFDAYFRLVRDTGHVLMPTIETADAFDDAEMRLLRAVFEAPGVRHRILALRIGGNDLLALLGLRRPRGMTIYRTPLGPVIARLVTTFRPYGFVLTAPVFEYLDLPELLDQEVSEDLAYGMVGKTAIHPTQIAPIERHYQVRPQDLAVARAILDQSARPCSAWTTRCARSPPTAPGPNGWSNSRTVSALPAPLPLKEKPHEQRHARPETQAGRSRLRPFLRRRHRHRRPGISVDVSCFGLDAGERLSDERYMVFYNQPASPEGAVRLDLSGGLARFQLNLDALPASIAKLVFVAAIDGAQTMRALGASALTLGTALRFSWSGADFGDEKAIILAELYRRDGQWRFGAVGQGFNGGLSALLAHFGGTEASPAAALAPAPAPAPAPAAAPRVSLSKITLEKRGDKVSLDKRAGQGYGRIHVNLNWNQSPLAPAPAPAKTGFFERITAPSAARWAARRAMRARAAAASTSIWAACTNWPTAAAARSRRSAIPSATMTVHRSCGSTPTTAPAPPPAARTCSSTASASTRSSAR
jgi:stress response protein SCP2